MAKKARDTDSSSPTENDGCCKLKQPPSSRSLKGKCARKHISWKKVKKYIDRKIDKAFKEHRASPELLIEQQVNKIVNCASAKRVKKRARPAQKRSSCKRIKGPEGRNLQLHFSSSLLQPYFAGGNIVGEDKRPIKIVLRDANTHELVTAGPESCSTVHVVVLEGDFNAEDDDNWTLEGFESCVVKERDGKPPLLDGGLKLRLKEGVGTIMDLKITDNSSWIRSGKFRLGAKVTSGFDEGMRIREAVTKAFKVKDRRGESSKKRYPPASSDAVWRLDKIAKNGTCHKKLDAAGIDTVGEFLRCLVERQHELPNILDHMPKKSWDALLAHAKSCPDANVILPGQQGYSADSHCEARKVHVETVKEKANDNGMDMDKPCEESELNILQNASRDAPRHEPPANQQQNMSSTTGQQLSPGFLNIVDLKENMSSTSGQQLSSCFLHSGSLGVPTLNSGNQQQKMSFTSGQQLSLGFLHPGSQGVPILNSDNQQQNVSSTSGQQLSLGFLHPGSLGVPTLNLADQKENMSSTSGQQLSSGFLHLGSLGVPTLNSDNQQQNMSSTSDQQLSPGFLHPSSQRVPILNPGNQQQKMSFTSGQQLSPGFLHPGSQGVPILKSDNQQQNMSSSSDQQLSPGFLHPGSLRAPTFNSGNQRQNMSSTSGQQLSSGFLHPGSQGVPTLNSDNQQQNMSSTSDQQLSLGFLLGFLHPGSLGAPTFNSGSSDFLEGFDIASPYGLPKWRLQNDAGDDPIVSAEASHCEAPIGPENCLSDGNQHALQNFPVPARHDQPENQLHPLEEEDQSQVRLMGTSLPRPSQ
ncbi:hypothetical protein Ancab_005306 [Ancistrocladus abbreviatus]